MAATGPGSPQAIANFIITKLTDVTIYFMDARDERRATARRRALEEEERISKEARRRAIGDIDDNVSWMGEREAEEGRKRSE
jgi:hypothetical protein